MTTRLGLPGQIALLRVSGLEVVGEAGSGPEAIDVVAQQRPDVGSHGPWTAEMGGIAATEHIVATYPDMRVVVITLYDDEQSVGAALEAGASGYVVKDASRDQIIAAIGAAEVGALWLGSGVPRPGSTPAALAATLPGLTRRETTVAELIGKGLTNPAIAERLGLSAKTVANYVSMIILKIGAEDRLEAARIVRDWHDRR